MQGNPSLSGKSLPGTKILSLLLAGENIFLASKYLTTREKSNYQRNRVELSYQRNLSLYGKLLLVQTKNDIQHPEKLVQMDIVIGK